MSAPLQALQTLRADALVVGAGPAGLTAACRLVEGGRSVLCIEQQPRPGGQIWRAGLPAHQARRLQLALAGGRLRLLTGHAVCAAEAPTRLLLETPDGALLRAEAGQLLIASGARERVLPLPGWTLPGVHGAGGLQALVKQGWPIRDRRVVLAGSGPLLLAAADSLRAAGARLLLIAEQTPARRLAGFAAGLDPARMTQALGLRWRLRGVPYRPGCWVTAVLGAEHIEGVRLSDGRREWELDCDALGLGLGLRPDTALATLLGCRIEAGAIAVDAGLRSSLPGVWAAGECTGIGGAHKSALEGELAALSMLGLEDRGLSRRHARALRFAAALERSFALRPDLLTLARPDTLVCRCEDVRLGALRGQPGWREARLQTRCGMGACQGRICGPICETLLGWAGAAADARPPLQPVPISAWLAAADQGAEDSTSTS